MVISLGRSVTRMKGIAHLNAERDLAIQNTCNHRVKYCDIMRILVKWCLSDHERRRCELRYSLGN